MSQPETTTLPDHDPRPGTTSARKGARITAPEAVAVRDLARYYALVERAKSDLRGRFALPELEALTYALGGVALVESPNQLYGVPAIVEDAVRLEFLCGQAGIPDCNGFLEKVHELDLAEIYALVDTVGLYLALPEEHRGEAGWRRLGLL